MCVAPRGKVRPRAPRRGPRPTPEPVRHLTADFSSYAAPPIGQRRDTFRPAFLTRDLTRDKTLPAQRAHTQTGTKLSLHGQNSPNSTLLGEQGEFCHGHAPKFLDRARSVRPQAVRSQVHPPARTSTGYSIDGRAPHTGPARPGCGARGRWRGLAGLRDRSLRADGSRVAISRAGRRPRAHKAARPWPRAAAHGHTKQPGRGHGPPPTGTQSSPAGAAAHATAVNPAAARAHNEAATGFPATASSMNER